MLNCVSEQHPAGVSEAACVTAGGVQWRRPADHRVSIHGAGSAINAAQDIYPKAYHYPDYS